MRVKIDENMIKRVATLAQDWAGENGQRYTFAELAELEPQLEVLATAVARTVDFGPWRTAASCWEHGIKPGFNWLVGWQRSDRHPILSTQEAYETVYFHLKWLFEKAPCNQRRR